MNIFEVVIFGGLAIAACFGLIIGWYCSLPAILILSGVFGLIALVTYALVKNLTKNSNGTSGGVGVAIIFGPIFIGALVALGGMWVTFMIRLIALILW